MASHPILHFEVLPLDRPGQSLVFTPRRVFNAAYAGRSAEDVARHIADVTGGAGMPTVPIPSLCSVTTHNLVSAGEIQEYNASMIGEVEYVLVSSQEGILLGVGSDHCDFALEAHDFTHSKNVAPNLISSQLWRLDDVMDYFDELVLECKVRVDGDWKVTQRASCATLRHPDFWTGHPAFGGRFAEGCVLFSGTINHLQGMVQGDAYEVSMSDPRTGRRLSHRYRCDFVSPPSELSAAGPPH